MSQSAIVLGPATKIRINGIDFDYTDGEAGIERKDHDTNDSSDAVYDQSRGGRKRLTASLTAQSATDVDVHGTDLLIAKNEFIDFKLYPWGVDEEPYHAPSFRVTTFKFTAPAKSGDPCTIRIEGHSSGAFTDPGD